MLMNAITTNIGNYRAVHRGKTMGVIQVNKQNHGRDTGKQNHGRDTGKQNHGRDTGKQTKPWV